MMQLLHNYICTVTKKNKLDCYLFVNNRLRVYATLAYLKYPGIRYGTSGRCGIVCSGLLNKVRSHFRTSPLLFQGEND